jgi:2-keto-4-pentenoate hydratase/2-oxohepta-3-ene-1,7-dioic acid hydratase in catechol pathway
MKLLSYRRDGLARHGYLVGDTESTIVELGDGDLSVLIARHGTLVGWQPPSDASTYPLSAVEVLAPVPRPPKVLAVAANYQEHVAEGGSAPLDKSRLAPRIFLKPTTSVAGPGDVIELPGHSTQVDWEAELVAVIGRGGRDIPIADALGHVVGYATGNDVSARSVDYGFPRDTGQVGASAVWFFDWLAGKWFDGFAPYGPYLVTSDEAGDPQDLRVVLDVNGHVYQDGSTRDMIFTVAELVAFSSRLMTLEPGDVLFTGTPAGVGAASGQFLSSGDEMTVRIGSLGTLINLVR